MFQHLRVTIGMTGQLHILNVLLVKTNNYSFS